MSNIPEEFKIQSPLSQKTYLVDGKLEIWNGAYTEVYSTIHSSNAKGEMAPTLLGTIPDMDEKAAKEVLETLGVEDPILEIAKKLESAALEDDYFKSRNLYPNVDFYSGIIYRALGIPTDMFTVMFAIGRLPGWIAQWKEMRENKEPIGRPRQIYIGHPLREFKR